MGDLAKEARPSRASLWKRALDLETRTFVLESKRFYLDVKDRFPGAPGPPSGRLLLTIQYEIMTDNYIFPSSFND